MCGVAGIYDLAGRGVDEDVLARMAQAIHHRGPDDHGVWCGDSVGLVNTRLSILDLTAAGHQPMHSDDGSIVLVYNGELANADARKHLYDFRLDAIMYVRQR